MKQGLEALLFLAEEPLSVAALADVLEAEGDDVEGGLLELAAEYERDGRGITIRRAAGGWRMYTAEVTHPVVERYVLAGRSGRLTQASLETLAVITYKQPISRQEISDIRGVNADAAVRSLVARGYVEEVGRDEGPGQAVLYGTTTLLLERLGLDELSELPPLTEFLPNEPAPDEPGLAHLKEARRRLAAGEDLPATGRGRWSPLDRATNTGPDESADAEGVPALPPVEPGASRRGQDEEMDELTVALERAARSAMAQLRDAVAATEEDADDGDSDTGDPAVDEPESREQGA